MDVITAIASKALDGLYARQSAIAQNVANAGAESYSPVRVEFEQQLRQAWDAAASATPEAALARIQQVQPELQTIPVLPGQGVKLDQEITNASETSARYAMLIGMLNRSLQAQMLAIRGG